MKIVHLFIFTLLMSISLFSMTVKIEAAPIEKDQVLKVGYIPDTNFVEQDWSGHYYGYGYEYMEILANYGHWNFIYVPCENWTEIGLKLQNGEIDIMPSMPGDYRQIRNSIQTDHVVGRFPMELVIRNLDVKPEMKIGTNRHNYPTPSLPAVAANEGFSYDLITYPERIDMIKAFDRDEIDGYIEAFVNPKKQRNLLAIFDRQSYRLLVRSDHTELLEQLNNAMDQMLLEQPNIRDRLQNKYYQAGGFPLILNYQEREYLQENRRLTAAILSNQKPYIFFENGYMKGAIPDVIRRISEDLNVEIEIVKANSLAEVSDMLQNGQVDFLADTVCDYSWTNSFNISPTKPYFDLEYVMVKSKDATENENPIVACNKDALYTKTFIEPHYPEEQRLNIQTYEEGFKAVSDGKADIIFVPRSEIPYLIEDTETYNLDITSNTYFVQSISFGVYKYADLRLWRILNKEINHLSAEWIKNTINKRHKTGDFRLTPKWLFYHHPVKVGMVFTLIGLAVIGFIWYRNNMRRKHLEIVQHMAYTDPRYNLPNLVWLESEMPQFLKDMRTKKNKNLIFVAVLAMESKTAVVERYGEELLVRHMRDMVKNLSQKDWVWQSAAGIDAGHLICICQAESEPKIIELLTEALPEYSYIKTKDSKIWLHMKAGICEYKTNDLSVRQVVERANIACHEPSTHDVQIFDDKMQENLTIQHKIEGHMEKALEAGEFKAWYQPKYDIKTRRIIGAEALVRWQSAEFGFMPPGKFIPLFEKNGFVIPVDYSILEQAFQLQKNRLAEGKEVVPISVNQSRLHMTEEGYIEKIKAIIDKYNLSPTGLIELEVTETVFGDFDQKANQKRAADIISKLHEMGFTISVDDFGSGYSSFMMLNYLPMDVMKIDRSLLDASGDSKRMRNILANVIKLGKTLNMQVICEGIETKEQENLLLELGCHYGQGFLNAKPMPLDEFVSFFEKRNAEVA